MTLKELREKQKQALDQAKAIQAKADNGVLSDEDQTAFDGLMDQFDAPRLILSQGHLEHRSS